MGERLYRVLETLTGVAEYEIEAKSKREALEKLRANEQGSMLSSDVEHTGLGTVEKISDV